MISPQLVGDLTFPTKSPGPNTISDERDFKVSHLPKILLQAFELFDCQRADGVYNICAVKTVRLCLNIKVSYK